MAIGLKSEPNHTTRLTTRGRVVLTAAWFAVLLAGMLTAKYGVPGWDL